MMTHAEQLQAMLDEKVVGGANCQPRRFNKGRDRFEYQVGLTWFSCSDSLLPVASAHIIPDPPVPPKPPVKKLVRREVDANGTVEVPGAPGEWGRLTLSDAMADPRCVSVFCKDGQEREIRVPAVCILYLRDGVPTLYPCEGASAVRPCAVEFEVDE